MDANQKNSIESKLRWAWHQERRFTHIRGAFRTLIWFLALLGICFLIDWGLFAKVGLRANLGVPLLVVSAAIFCWAFWHEWLRHLKPYDPVHVSLAVERRHTGLNSLLVSYAQLDPNKADKATVSTELIGAMRDQAVVEARPLDFREIVNFGQLKKPLLVGAGLFLLFAALSARWSEHVGVFFQRLAGSKVPYPTQTQLNKLSGDLTVRIGDSAFVNATVFGVTPTEGRLFTRSAGSGASYKELPMKGDEAPASYTREVKGLTSDLQYYVRIGDFRSEEYTIRVITAPQIVETKVALQYPEYMKKDPISLKELNLEVPEETKLTWTLTCTPAVKRCEVIIGDKATDAKLDETGTKLEFEYTAKEAFKYTFRWTEREKDFQYDDVQYAVKVMPDAPPEVELQRPTANGLGTAQKIVDIAARASDDYGLDKAWLVYSINGGEEVRKEIQDCKGAPGQEISYKWKLSDVVDAKLTLPVQVALALEVTDLHKDQANHKRRSSTRVITVVTEDVYLEWYKAEVAAQMEALKRMEDSEKSGLNNVKAIRAEEDTSKTPK